uniref:Putative secreted protein n=1 Tax=Anopheles darlingi TaxID=43151 RepID=A0A2M4D485_ANODA
MYVCVFVCCFYHIILLLRFTVLCKGLFSFVNVCSIKRVRVRNCFFSSAVFVHLSNAHFASYLPSFRLCSFGFNFSFCYFLSRPSSCPVHSD